MVVKIIVKMFEGGHLFSFKRKRKDTASIKEAVRAVDESPAYGVSQKKTEITETLG